MNLRNEGGNAGNRGVNAGNLVRTRGMHGWNERNLGGNDKN